MAVTPAYGFAVPAPAAASFTNGERAISVATPIGNAAARTTFYLSRWFDFHGGTYTFKVFCDDSAAFLASMSQNNGRVLFTHTIGAGTLEFTVYIPRGRKRLDVILNNLSTGVSPCYVAFSIWQFGAVVYASDSPLWVFDTAPIPDADVPAIGDERLSYPLFSVLPNWSGGVTERLEWRTEILTSESDVEQRRSLRRFARRTFEASFLRRGVQRQRLDNFFNGIGKREFLLPLWHEQFPLSTSLGSSLQFPTGTLALREFNVGDLAVVYAQHDEFEVLSVSAVNLSTDTISFASAPSGSWGLGHRIMPLRVAYLMDAARFENLTDDVATVQARFEMRDPEKWPNPSWGYCSPLFRFSVDRRSPVSLDFSRNTFTLDNEIGRVDITDLAERTRLGMRVALTLRGRAQVNRFRAFLHNARGRAVRFWMPDQMQDISVAGDFSGTTFDAVPNGYSEYMVAPQESRRLLAIVFNDGRPNLYRTVNAVTRLGDFERFFVSPALPPIQREDVRQMMFIVPMRFDQDGFELQHPVDDSAVIRTTLVMRSTDRNEIPAVDCTVTRDLVFTYSIG